MHPTHALRCTLSGAACISMWSVPAFAQTDTVRWRDAADTVSIQAHAGIVRVYEPHQSSTSPDAGVPANITVGGELRALVASMLRMSPTFRRQCLRIGGTRHLTVTLGHRLQYIQGPRARTRVHTARHGPRHAVVEVLGAHDLAELIAHELEHIIEQLDGIDLARKVAAPTSGVWRTGDGAFETTRAIRTGRAVAGEMGQRRE